MQLPSHQDISERKMGLLLILAHLLNLILAHPLMAVIGDSMEADPHFDYFVALSSFLVPSFHFGGCGFCLNVVFEVS